jgi:thymidylate synthase
MVKTILNEGEDITFGDAEEKKYARNIYGVLILERPAIVKAIDKTPKTYPWGGKKAQVFRDEFLADCRKLEVSKQGFDYTYPDLLKCFHAKNSEYGMNQFYVSLDKLREDIKTGISSNRNIGVLYNPCTMYKMKNLPCFNEFQVVYEGDAKGSLRLTFRSHDWGTAVWANIMSIANAFNELVFKPADCKLNNIIINSYSAHIYKNDMGHYEKMLNSKTTKYFHGLSKAVQ